MTARSRRPLAALFSLLPVAAMLTPGVAAGPAGVVTVRPRETDDLLANPGMGWQTFHHTRKQDRNLPAWIPSTIHYARWGWRDLEPEPGKLDEAFLDRVLQETRESGQKLAFRVMCCSTSRGHPYHPAWLADVGGRVLEGNHEGQAGLLVPDLDDPEVLARHLDFLRRLGKRYDDHPDIDHVDLGTVGWWGEWHMSGSKLKMPSLENRMKIVRTYQEAFRKTPLVMLIGGGPCLTHAVRHGAGWRADCIGDMGGFSRNWCHMRQGYPAWIKESGLQDTWKTAPVAWETCWDMRKWVQERWPLRHIFNYALALHGSHLNNKSAPLPEGPEVRPEIERFLRRLGYRLVLKELKHPAQAKPGQTMELAMQWQNTGSAPCYRPYRLACRLSAEDGAGKVIVGKTTVNRWLPGSVELFTKAFFEAAPDLPPGEMQSATEALALPADLAPGRYTLSIAVVAEKTAAPVVRLGIEGRDRQGWYPVSQIEISK